ncbi:MAG: cyclophilin-like fold protein [Algoriphagus sp.]|nr:cyclophilin-like fold protein [Algoriphagus sp.]
MKKRFPLSTLILVLLIGLTSITTTSCERTEAQGQVPNTTDMKNTGKKITIQAGKKTFTATLLENETSEKFYSLLPLTVTMTDLNRNEKYYRLPQNLPTNASNTGTIQNGDLMLWGANTVVIFYETFSTSYPYTRLGKIDNPDGLKEALGSGDITISFKKP